MKGNNYLFDTHALIFWYQQADVSPEFLAFFDEQSQQGKLFVSSVSFWEIGLLAQKGRITITNVNTWAKELLALSGIRLAEPSVTEMIDSTLLPSHHKDPFDRLLIAQAKHRDFIFVSRDALVQAYDVTTYWL